MTWVQVVTCQPFVSGLFVPPDCTTASPAQGGGTQHRPNSWHEECISLAGCEGRAGGKQFESMCTHTSHGHIYSTEPSLTVETGLEGLLQVSGLAPKTPVIYLLVDLHTLPDYRIVQLAGRTGSFFLARAGIA